MSTMSFLLVFLLCLGVTEAYVLCAKDPVLDEASDGSESIAKAFMETLRNAIKDKDNGKLDTMIINDFLFVNISESYNKKEMLDMLSQSFSNTEFKIEFESSHFVRRQSIQFSSIASQNGVTARVIFVIEATNEKWQLVRGHVPLCPEARSFSSPNDAESIAKTFLADFKSDLAKRNKEILAKRFTEKFVFYGCNRYYTKEEAVGLLVFIPPTDLPSMTFKSAKFTRDSVQYIVTVNLFKIPEFDAEFYLKNENGDYVLSTGRVPKCFVDFR